MKKKLEINKDCQIPADILTEIYEAYLPDMGTFVEVGAYDGVTHSNTLCLLKAGWRGVMVEPVLEHYVGMTKNLSSYTCEFINLAVSDDTGSADMFVRGELTTTNPEFTEVLDSMAFASDIKRVEKVGLITLENIADYLRLRSIGLLVVDTEGSEDKVIAKMGAKLNPRVIIIELHEESDMWNKFDRVRDVTNRVKATLAAKYESVYKDDINTIFIRKDLL